MSGSHVRNRVNDAPNRDAQIEQVRAAQRKQNRSQTIAVAALVVALLALVGVVYFQQRQSDSQDKVIGAVSTALEAQRKQFDICKTVDHPETDPACQKPVAPPATTVIERTGIQGIQGVQGIQGIQGVQGVPGRAPTNQEILNAVTTYCGATTQPCTGPAGRDGANGVNGVDGTNGIDGTNGTNGVDGKDGVNGKDGRGIESMSCNDAGQWVIHYTDGTTQTVADSECKTTPPGQVSVTP